MEFRHLRRDYMRCRHPAKEQLSLHWSPVESTRTKPGKLRIACLVCDMTILTFQTTVLDPLEYPVKLYPDAGSTSVKLPNGYYLSTNDLPKVEASALPEGGLLVKTATVCLHCTNRCMEVDDSKDCKFVSYKR